jgi:polyisoprenoid-binding protein YceI
MNTATIPTATFTLTKPIDLGTVPADAQAITATASGDLLLHGVTKPVTFELTAKRSGAKIAVSGSIDVKFADYDITNPSGGPVTTEDHGLIEFALAFSQAG